MAVVKKNTGIKKAFDIIYDVETRMYKRVNVKYNLKTGEASVDSIEELGQIAHKVIYDCGLALQKHIVAIKPKR